MTCFDDDSSCSATCFDDDSSCSVTCFDDDSRVLLEVRAHTRQQEMAENGNLWNSVEKHEEGVQLRIS